MKTLHVVLAQLTPKLRAVRANIETAKRVVAGHPGGDLIVFPELFLGGYTTNGIERLALDLDGPEVGGWRGSRARAAPP